jgi:hypothetical protein
MAAGRTCPGNGLVSGSCSSPESLARNGFDGLAKAAHGKELHDMTSLEEKLEKQTAETGTVTETGDAHKNSTRETWILSLKVAAIATLILGAIWLIEFMKG